MDVDKLNTGEKIAGVSAVLLFIFMFFDWFGVEDLRRRRDRLASASGAGGSAWDALDFIPIVLVITIVVALVNVFLRLSDSDYEPPISMNVAVAVLGGLSTLLVLFRIIDPPGFGTFGGVSVDATLEFGIFLGLVTAAGIAYGGYRGMQEEGSSFSGTADKLSRRRPERPAATAVFDASTSAAPTARSVAGRRISREAPAVRSRPVLSRDLLREGDDGHHRVDADRGGEEGGVGDVEVAGAVDRAVDGAGALAWVGGDARGAHRVEGLEAQLRGLEGGRLELGQVAGLEDADAGDVGVDLGGAGGEVDFGGAGDAEGEPVGVARRSACSWRAASPRRRARPGPRSRRRGGRRSSRRGRSRASPLVDSPGAEQPGAAEGERGEGRLEQDPCVLPLVDVVALHHPVPAAHLLLVAGADPAGGVDVEVAADLLAAEPGALQQLRRAEGAAGGDHGAAGAHREGRGARRRRRPGSSS